MNKAPDLVGIVLVAVCLALSALMFPRLPDPMPVHWDLLGNPDGQMPRAWGAFLVPAAAALVWLVLLVLPRISPRGFAIEPFAREWRVFQYAVLGFLLFAQWLMLHAAASRRPLPTWLFQVGLGVLLVAVGNLFGKTTRNFFFGIRTPWTLASGEVWLRTHRLAGRLIVVSGALVILAALFDLGSLLILPAVLLAALISVVYSYVIYRRIDATETRQPSTGGGEVG
jgi:uncharacterized membrane protein